MNKTTDLLFDYLKNILYHPECAQLDIPSLPPDFQKLAQGMVFLGDCIREEREFYHALADGNLSATPPSAENILAAPAKALQSSLRHLQWQTQQVAKGDYSQRVDFMGEFSTAFNTMTRQLEERSNSLLEEKKLVEEKNLNLKRNLDLMRALANFTHNMIFVLSSETGELIFANQPGEWFQKTNPASASLLLDRLRLCPFRQGNDSEDWETTLPSFSEKGDIFFGIESFSFYRENTPAVVHIVMDETERKKKETLIRKLAYADSLTGLNNRRYATDLMERWYTEHMAFLLSFVDVDHLKYCNDTFGHETGDRYLLDVAHLLETIHCRVCRIGGDEFLLLALGTDTESQDGQLRHLREFLMAQTDTAYPQSFSYASICVPADPPLPLNDYIRQADEKMYQYKIRNKPPLPHK